MSLVNFGDDNKNPRNNFTQFFEYIWHRVMKFLNYLNFPPVCGYFPVLHAWASLLLFLSYYLVIYLFSLSINWAVNKLFLLN